MKPNTKQILQFMHVLFWVLFIGLCIKAGALLFTFILSFYNSNAAHDLYQGLDLSRLKDWSLYHYFCLTLTLLIITGMKAFLCLLPIKIFKQISFSNPFSQAVAMLVSRIGHTSLLIGLLSLVLARYEQWLGKKDVNLVGTGDFYGGGYEFLFFAGIIYIISLVYQRGIEIQSENELTV